MNPHNNKGGSGLHLADQPRPYESLRNKYRVSGGITYRFIFRARPEAVNEIVRCLQELRALAQRHGILMPTRIYPARRFPRPSHDVAWEWDGPNPFEALEQVLVAEDGARQTYQRTMEHLETVMESVRLEVWERDDESPDAHRMN